MAMCCKSNISLFDFVVLTHLFKLLSFFFQFIIINYQLQVMKCYFTAYRYYNMQRTATLE